MRGFKTQRLRRALCEFLLTIAFGLLCGAAVTLSVWGIEITVKTAWKIAEALFDTLVRA